MPIGEEEYRRALSEPIVRCRRQAALMRLLSALPVGVISGLILFRLVTFWGRSAMGWSVPFFVGRVFS